MSNVTEFVLPAIMLIIALLSPLLAWWGSTRYFAGMMHAQQEASLTWRHSCEKRLEEIEEVLRANSYSALLVRISRLEQDIGELRQWKHVKAEAYIGAVDVLKTRVDALNHRFDLLDRRNHGE